VSLGCTKSNIDYCLTLVARRQSSDVMTYSACRLRHFLDYHALVVSQRCQVNLAGATPLDTQTDLPFNTSKHRPTNRLRRHADRYGTGVDWQYRRPGVGVCRIPRCFSITAVHYLARVTNGWDEDGERG